MRIGYCQGSLVKLAVAGVALITGIASATDFRLTGFGTIGYARSSERDLTYLRYIDHGGTLKADSLAGVQAEAQINSQWGATVQAIASAPRDRDDGTEAKIRWAFVSFRPGNDWLIRAGRVRPPVFINTQNSEVGVTYDQARLPVEVYSLSPIYDADGAVVTKTWAAGSAEINADAYWGTSDTKFRLPYQRAGTQTYFPAKFDLKGFVLSHASGPLFIRGSVHHATLKARGSDKFVENFSPIPFPAPDPYGGTLYTPSKFLDKVHVNVVTFGADWHVGDWRITGEYGQRIVPDAEIGTASKSAYLTVARGVGKWTPYVTHARLLSDSGVRQIYQRVNTTPVPLGAQGPPLSLPANYHRILADQIYVYDQYSTMLGTSYSFTATSKLKFEWMHTKVGLRSTLVDGDVSDKGFNVYSVSYSVSF